MHLIHCSSVDAFVAVAGAIGRFLLARGRLLVVIDANGPVEGLIGIYSEARGQKYFRGPNPPQLGELSDTEYVLYGI
jgi:hypothetical protein